MSLTPSSVQPTAPVTTSLAQPSPRRTIRRVLEKYGVIGFFLVLFVVLSFTTTTFFTTGNLRNVLDGAVVVGLLGIGGLVVIMAGGFDLSAGSILAVSAISTGLLVNEYGSVIGVGLAIAIGGLLGLVNGLLCTVGRINAFVGTLGTSIAFQGIAVILSNSSQIVIEDQSFRGYSSTEFLGINSSTWIFIALTILFAILLSKTIFGRHIAATGGNVQAARLSGVAITRTVLLTFVLSGLIAGVAGTIVASRSLVIGPGVAGSQVYEALAAILIGGNALFGGKGAIWRVIVGVATLALISNGFNLLGVPPLFQQTVTGTLVVLAIGIEAWRRKR